MSEFMMSDSLKGILDERQFLEKKQSQPVVGAQGPFLVIRCEHEEIVGKIILLEWDGYKRLTKAVMELDNNHFQTILEGFLPKDLGYRTGIYEKTSWMITEQTGAVTIDNMGKTFFLTITYSY